MKPPKQALLLPELPPLAALTAHLADSEARQPDIWPGAEKTVIWAGSKQRSTPLALVYLHGFSACRQETAPLCEQVAEALGANLFYTRLQGHGCPAVSLLDCHPEHWYADALEALAVGRRLGERVVLVGCSTGATLATWLAMRPEAEALQSLVLLSPNYGLRHPLAELLTTPLGTPLLRLVVGREYRFEPVNADHARYWSNRYPAIALQRMMSMVKAVRSSPLALIRTPTLCLYNPHDRLVNARRIEPTVARFGAARRLCRQITPDDPERHVPAGDILSPSSTATVAREIVDFIEASG